MISRQYEMTISRADFARLLPAAVGHATFAADDAGYAGGSEGRRWVIAVQPMADLTMGGLRLPRLRVTLSFAGYSAPEVEEFMARFDLYFRRGGG